MKKNKKDLENPEKHGIISIVQSPDLGENNAVDATEADGENEANKPKEHGIISVVQSPDEVKDKENE